jgi:hypothetical protein
MPGQADFVGKRFGTINAALEAVAGSFSLRLRGITVSAETKMAFNGARFAADFSHR